jgi:hypothetical protein
LGNPKQKTKSSLNHKVGFMFDSEIQSRFLAVVFFKFLFESVFSKQVFKFWFLRSISFLFVSKVSGSFYRVAKIGFKVFSLRFGQLWF